MTKPRKPRNAKTRIEFRIKKLEVKLDKANRRFRTVYHRYYAYAIRRVKSEDEIRYRLNSSVKNLESKKHQMHRLNYLLTKLKRGKALIYLDTQIANQFRAWIKKGCWKKFH